ncbi:MAG: rRNA methyltransferase [Flavobacteriaceae bacterium]|nr:rRNA methyltransferase [Flavobacteriaceae bacterium]OUX40534.1 MAG: rRNA methyltransferase [Flavobacteriaceae bacterium TMED265]
MNKDLFQFLQGFVSSERLLRFEQILALRTRHLCVAVEDVYQLHNTSAILRSCDSFGIQDVHVLEHRFNDRLDTQIAMGADKWLSVYKHESTKDCITHLKARGYKIVATVPDDNVQSFHQMEFDHKSALFFGTEKSGLSDDVLKQSDEFITIPTFGFTKSLNISVSAAIILQLLTEKLRSIELKWGLRDDEKQTIREEWIKKSIKNVDQITERFLSNSL